jgi:hypothetical protein
MPVMQRPCLFCGLLRSHAGENSMSRKHLATYVSNDFFSMHYAWKLYHKKGNHKRIKYGYTCTPIYMPY